MMIDGIDEPTFRVAWAEGAQAVLEKVLAAQQKAVDGFDAPPATQTGAEAKAGEPLLCPEDIVVDAGRFAVLLDEIISVIQEWIGGDAILTGTAEPTSNERIAAYLRAAIAGGGALAEELQDVSGQPDALAVAVRYALAPFVGVSADKVRDAIVGDARSVPRCPVCGAEPLMAEIDRGDGHRELGCSLCGTHWRFARMVCPFCGTDDQQQFEVLTVETLEGYRIECCNACDRYIKTIDRRERLEPRTLELADILTPELDEIALERACGTRGPVPEAT
jgi:FdhE protein